MSDHLDHENNETIRRFLARRELREPLPAREPVIPLDISAEAQHLIAESNAAERALVIRIHEREQQRLEAEARAAAALVDVPAYDASLSNDTLRDTLQAAIEAHDAAMVEVGKCESALERARQRIADTNTDLRAYHDLDQRVVEWHTDQIRRDAIGDLPTALADEVMQRDVVISRLDAIHKSADRLQSELHQAKRELAQCAAVRTHAAAHVIAHHADQIAASLDQAMNRAEELRRQLLSASSTWLTTVNGAVSLPLSQRARIAAHRQLLDGMPLATYREAFTDWLKRLENDSQALLAEG